jgi:hypothetical protein
MQRDATSHNNKEIADRHLAAKLLRDLRLRNDGKDAQSALVASKISTPRAQHGATWRNNKKMSGARRRTQGLGVQ